MNKWVWHECGYKLHPSHPQLATAQSRCRDMMAAKDSLEEEVTELRRERQASDKRHSLVSPERYMCYCYLVLCAASRETKHAIP